MKVYYEISTKLKNGCSGGTSGESNGIEFINVLTYELKHLEKDDVMEVSVTIKAEKY